MEFTSVRAINKAIADAAQGLRGGKQPRVITNSGVLQIIRAKADSLGFLKVRLVATGEWVSCNWGDVVMQ